jgi:hypothetical protein
MTAEPARFFPFRAAPQLDVFAPRGSAKAAGRLAHPAAKALKWLRFREIQGLGGRSRPYLPSAIIALALPTTSGEA